MWVVAIIAPSTICASVVVVVSDVVVVVNADVVVVDVFVVVAVVIVAIVAVVAVVVDRSMCAVYVYCCCQLNSQQQQRTPCSKHESERRETGASALLQREYLYIFTSESHTSSRGRTENPREKSLTE